MIGLFQKMFGDHFWENAILEATHWNYHEQNMRLRESSQPPIREEWWTSEFNKLFKDVSESNSFYIIFLSFLIGHYFC